jgi:hypothetical protein
MTIQYEMNKPKVFKIGHSDAVLACGYEHNWWLKRALEYLPEDLFEQNAKGFLFTSTAASDACRVARRYCQTREIILISERILPGRKVSEVTDPKARYFIYAVLHEMAHAIGEHKSPFLDNLTKEECEAEEKEADELAMKWFNDHVAKLKNEHLRPITKEEIKEAQKMNQIVMKKLMGGL